MNGFAPCTMKKTLSLLMCYVFLQAETFALRGGPTGAGAGKVVGSYSGVMIEINAATNADVGLFLLTAAEGGPSIGNFVIFSESKAVSKVYIGKITGLSDTSRGGSGKFYGLFAGAAATGTPTSTLGSTGSESIAGQMILTVVPGRSTQPRISGTASSRATGDTTTIDPTTGLPITSTVTAPLKYFTVDGWQTAYTSSLSFAL